MNIRMGINRIHGGKSSLDLKNKTKLLDFSLNVNPFSLPAKYLPSLDKIKDYPDFKNLEIKNLLAKKFNLLKENFFIGNGTSEIITLIFLCFVKKGESVFALWPSFSDYKYFTDVINARFIPLWLNPPDFKINLQKILKQSKNKKQRLFFFCNPVNPTGKYYKKDIVISILKSLPKETIFVLDEAYINFVDKKWDSIKLLKTYKNLIILRSLTKDYGFAGLRIGYSISSKEVAAILNAIAPSWNVNTLAQEVTIKALKDDKFVSESVSKINSEKFRVEKSLKDLGYEFVPSDVNFYLLKVKNATKSAKVLLRKNILVRDCTSLGLPDYLRISINAKFDNDVLLKILESTKLYE